MLFSVLFTCLMGAPHCYAAFGLTVSAIAAYALLLGATPPPWCARRAHQRRAPLFRYGWWQQARPVGEGNGMSA
jgi:hypothetical protein